ncbi:MAG: transcription elongation factor GreA [Clostridia bacterium]|nr:transcription elongation factor GreA [Clostridia bacterium]
MAEEILLTQQGYDDLVKEHEYLVSVRRAEVSEHLKEAKSYGDLSENAEYDAAKDEQRDLEERIARIEYMMRNAKVISEEELTGDSVNLGLTVKIKDVETKEKYTYTIVGITNADPFEGKISNESPVGKALLGKRKGEKVEVVMPDNKTVTYQIMEIIKNE